MSDPGEIWKSWIQRFWWLRGVAGAMTVAALVPSFVDLSRYEFLRAFHAIIVGWDLVAAELGRLIGRVPFFPNIDSDAVNTIVFVLAFVFPVSIALIKSVLK